MVDAILECCLILTSLFYLCNKLKMPYACFYMPQASSPHKHHTHTVSSCVRNATHLSVAQHRHWYTNAYIQCGRTRDIDAIWKSHLTHTAWDKWGKKICATHVHHGKNFFWKSLFALALQLSDTPKHRCQLVIRKEVEGGMGLDCGTEGELVTLSFLPSPRFASRLDPA